MFLASLAKCSTLGSCSVNICLKNSFYNPQEDSFEVIVDASAEIDSDLRTVEEMATRVS